MGPILGNKCAWAAFLGNVAIETKELTIWKVSPNPHLNPNPNTLTP